MEKSVVRAQNEYNQKDRGRPRLPIAKKRDQRKKQKRCVEKEEDEKSWLR